MSAGDDLPSAMYHSSRRRSSEPLTVADAEWLLAGRGAHPEAPVAQHALARLLGDAAGPPTDQELAGEVAAVAAFMLITGHRRARHAHNRKRFRILPLRIRAMAAAVSAGGVVAFSGAAVANALPASIQELAHRTFDAPAPRHAILVPKVPASSSGHGHGDPNPKPSPGPSAQSHHGKATEKRSPSRSAHGRTRTPSVPSAARRANSPSALGRGKG